MQMLCPYRYASAAMHVLVLAALCLPARAEAANVTIGLLGLDASSVQASMGPAVTEALHRSIPTLHGMRVVMSQQDLVEVKLVFNCTDEKPACMAKVGKSLGVNRLIYGSIRKQQGNAFYTVAIKQLNVADATVEKFISESVPMHILTPNSPDLDQLVQKWLRVLLIEGLRGGLKIVSQPPGAMVTLDGNPLGQTPLSFNEVDVGDHVVKIDLDGYSSVVRPITIRGGTVHEVTAELAPRIKHTVPLVVTKSAPPPPINYSRIFRITSYVLGGVAVVSAIAAIGTWRGYVADEDGASHSLDLLQADLTAAGTVGNYRGFFGSSQQLSSCSGDASLMQNPNYQSYMDQCQHGNKLASATTGLWIVAGTATVLGVAAAVLASRLKRPDPKLRNENAGKPKPMQLDSEPPIAQPPSASLAPRLVGVAPAAGPTGGGLNVLFSF